MNCEHDVSYYGAMNLDLQGHTFGSIDVWRCRKCRAILCEDKRWGQMELASEVGFPNLKEGAKWMAIVCQSRGRLNWTLAQVKLGEAFDHTCASGSQTKIKIREDFSIEYEGEECDHRVYHVEDFVNKAVEVGV